jgi:predicted small secreted protein
MKTPSKNLAIIVLAAVSAAILTSSCGTVRGFGRDVGTVGRGIQKSAR